MPGAGDGSAVFFVVSGDPLSIGVRGSTSDSEAAREERVDFYQDEGWVATNSRIGTPNELEFKFNLPLEPFSLAINILRSSNQDSKIPYPADLPDGVISPTPGGLRQVLPFTPELWAVVNLEE